MSQGLDAAAVKSATITPHPGVQQAQPAHAANAPVPSGLEAATLNSPALNSVPAAVGDPAKAKFQELGATLLFEKVLFMHHEPEIASRTSYQKTTSAS